MSHFVQYQHTCNVRSKRLSSLICIPTHAYVKKKTDMKCVGLVGHTKTRGAQPLGEKGSKINQNELPEALVGKNQNLGHAPKCAGWEKRLFNVIFFLKVEPSCNQT